MSDKWLPPDLEDLLGAERDRPAEAAPDLERLREHLEATLGSFDGGDGGADQSGGSGGGGGSSASAGGAAKALAAKLVATALGALAIGAVAGAHWQASRDSQVVVPPAPLAAASAAGSAPAASAAPLVPRVVGQASASPPALAVAPQWPAQRAAAPVESLAAERTLIDVARTAASVGKTDDALAALDRHSRRFPAGIMAEEREGLRVEVLAAACGVVPSFVEFGWRRIGNYATFSVASTTAGLSFAS